MLSSKLLLFKIEIIVQKNIIANTKHGKLNDLKSPESSEIVIENAGMYEDDMLK